MYQQMVIRSKTMLTSRLETSRETLAVEKLCAEVADVEANPLGEMFMSGMSYDRKKRVKQLSSRSRD